MSKTHGLVSPSGFAAAASLALLAIAPAATAGTNIGWVLADQPNATSPYQANPAYSYDSFGGTVTVTPEGVGSYGVDFGGFPDTRFTNVQITTYDSPNYCLYQFGGPHQIILNCFDWNGNFANTEFALLVQRRFGSRGNAYHAFGFLRAYEPTTPFYKPDYEDQYNSLGGADTVTRNGIGSYTAYFPDLVWPGGTVQVTSEERYFQSAPCAVASWSSNSSGTSVNVNCFDRSGNPFDNEFQVAYSIGYTFGHYGLGARHGVYAWATQPERTKPYYTVSTYNYNGFGTGALIAQKTGHGTYSLTIPGTISYTSSVALVTAVGASSTYCNLAGWTHQTINVACYAQGGTPVDSQFAVTFQTAP